MKRIYVMQKCVLLWLRNKYGGSEPISVQKSTVEIVACVMLLYRLSALTCAFL